MSNPFLASHIKDLPTAKLYEKAIIVDLENEFHTNAPALTEGKNIYLNTEDNLFKTLPNYNQDMLKWLLWHEQQHLNLRHHNRFFRYIDELKKSDSLDKFQVTKEEVNIIMDILVHDSLCKWFPELIPTAKENLVQLRNRNSLKYTFKTNTLEQMLDEYKDFKYKPEDEKDDDSKVKGGSKEDTDSTDKSKDVDKMRKDESKTGRKAHKEGGHSHTDKDTSEDKEELRTDGDNPDMPDEHDDADWSKLDKIDQDEFITEEQAETIQEAIKRLKQKKIKLAKITETLNGLATDKRTRTYARPSRIQMPGIILKGHQPSKAKLYLVFDASGSMSSDMKLFKEIIQQSIPQAMDCPCEWFSGEYADEKLNYDKTYHGRKYKDYYKGTFKDFLEVHADSGYSDDGDRVIELCALAEEKGYNPIGVTDGGGCIRYEDTLKKLKRTVLVGDCKEWLKKAKEINPTIQIIYTGLDD